MCPVLQITFLNLPGKMAPTTLWLLHKISWNRKQAHGPTKTVDKHYNCGSSLVLTRVLKYITSQNKQIIPHYKEKVLMQKHQPQTEESIKIKYLIDNSWTSPHLLPTWL